MRKQITIINLPLPKRHDLNYELQWLGSSLGLFSLRDRDKSCFRVFVTLLRASKRKHSLTSDELAHHLHLTRATVIHHINKLMKSGLVVRQDKRYILRVEDLEQLIHEVRQDMERSLEQMRKVAEDIDNLMRL